MFRSRIHNWTKKQNSFSLSWTYDDEFGHEMEILGRDEDLEGGLLGQPNELVAAHRSNACLLRLPVQKKHYSSFY